MFYECSSLISLNLSNFYISKVEDINNMFSGCANLEYINLKKFDEKNLQDSPIYFQNMFDKIPKNVVICISIDKRNKIYSQIKAECLITECVDNWKPRQNKVIYNNNKIECSRSCNSSPNKYEYNGKFIDHCEKGYLYDENNNQLDKCKCELDECLLCPNIALNKGLCTKCNTGYYPKENDPLNFDEYIKCYNNPEGYYLKDNIYKPCYQSCKECNISGNDYNHNCIKCNDNLVEITNKNYLNCYEKCDSYYYLDDDNNYICISSCPNGYIDLNEDKMKCIKNNINNIVDEIILEKKELEKMSKEEEIRYYDNIIKTIEKGIEKNYDTRKLDNGEYEIKEIEKMKWTLTTLKNEKNHINNKNMTSIDLGNCETSLRNEYNIPGNKELYIKKIEIFEEKMKSFNVEYDVFCKLFGTNLMKLNLIACSNDKILIYIHFIMNGNIDKYNTNSGYYNDICYTTISEYRTDITLKDRQENFIEKGKTLCQEGCAFSKYDTKISKAICSCAPKKYSSSLADVTFDKTKKTLINF